MTWQATLLGVLCGAAATVALAHDGVQNPAVKARMDAMSAIGKNTKVIGEMVKGTTAFDPARAQQAAERIAAKAAMAPDLFRAEEDDPKSEARGEIWEQFDDFVAKSQELQSVASAAASEIETRGDLRAALGDIAAACKSCHRTYRE